ncbi:MAG: methyltransferase domain-containing protein [Planctomycetota bacterium]|jgi:SAM-dependent methyltransferase
MDANIEGHYARTDLGETILEALAVDGKRIERLTMEDLAPVDEFHIRGREATLELAGLAAPEEHERVLDVGSGLGGSARHLASNYGCAVTGIDLTADYCEVASMLSELVGLGDRTSFRQASALAMPFEDGSFDCAWTEHVQMNIADKRAFYGEIARVLRPGGRLVFHDVFGGRAGAPHFPVPWAESPELSALIEPEELRATLEETGYEIVEWRDLTQEAAAWFDAMATRRQRPRTGIALLMGATAPEKLANMRRNLTEGRISVVLGMVRVA